MSDYQLSYTQIINISKDEYQRIAKLLETNHRIITITDLEGNIHLVDWYYVSENQVNVIKPESLPE